VASEFDIHYALLNPEQKRAVDHVDGPMLVLAGAGTGKTQIIALRIAKLLQVTQLEPSNVLCLTFTESGVSAMRQRLISLIGQPGYSVRVNTFHSFCNDIIQEHPELFFSTKTLEALTDIERIQLLEQVIDTLPADSVLKPFGAPYYYLPDLVRSIQTLKRENVTFERYQELLDQAERQLGEPPAEDATATAKRLYQSALKQFAKQQALAAVYEQYQKLLAEWGKYDYEDMLLFVVKAFKQNADLLADYQERFQYILVDEYQDTNGAQNEVIRLLGSHIEQPNIFVVGDDRQSIYRFQGASLENILFFHELYGKETKLVSLKNNYRSQQFVLDAAEAVIAHNTQSLAKYIPELESHLIAARDLDTLPIQLATFQSPQSEAWWIAQQVHTLITQGVAPSQIAVLYRNNSDANELVDMLSRQGTSFYLAGGANILNDPLINQFIAVLRYAGMVGSDDSLFALLHYPFLHLPADAVARATYQAHQTKQWLFEVLRQNQDSALKKLADRMMSWRESSGVLVFTEWFTKVLQESGWMDYVLQLPNHVEHLNRMNTLFSELKQLNRTNATLTIKQVIEYLDMLQQHDLILAEADIYTNRQAVQLMTAHRAKGLEFEHVFIMKCVDKHWGNVPDRSKIKLPAGILKLDPTVDEDEKNKKNEDERRLFYVALTRAKQKAYVSYADHSATGRGVVPSMFIAELPTDVTTQIDTTAIEEAAQERLQLSLAPVKPIDHSSADRAWLEAIIERYKMSATHLNDYLECPRLFYYQDILRVPRSTSRAVGYGIAVHNALRDASAQFNASKKMPAANWVIAQFEYHLDQQLLSKQDLKDSKEFGRSSLGEYLQDQLDMVVKNAYPEHDFGPYHVLVGEVPITGKIDSIQIIDAKKKLVHVVDYKTGNPDNKASNLAPNGSYHRQLLFYKLLCDGAKQFGHIAMSGEINFIQKSKTKNKFVNRVYEFTEADVEQTRSEIMAVYADIKALKFLDPDPAALCGECVYCQLFK